MSKSSSARSTSTTIQEPKKTGRPLKELNPADAIRGLASIGLPHTKIAQIMNISRTQLYERFRTELTMGRAEGDAELLQAAKARAIEKSDSFLVFLLKNRVGYSEKLDVTESSESELKLKEELGELWNQIEQVTGWRDVTPKEGASGTNDGTSQTAREGESQEIRGPEDSPGLIRREAGPEAGADRAEGGQPAPLPNGDESNKPNS